MLNEDYVPEEIITIRMERKWRYLRPEERKVKQTYEFPVRVILNTGKAILVTQKDKSSYVDAKRGEALWIPSYAMKLIGNKKYSLKSSAVDSSNLSRFLKKYEYKPISEEPLKEMEFFSFTEYLIESSSFSSSQRNKINAEFSSKNFGSYFKTIPFKKIEDILKKYGLYLVDEDGTPWDGIITGESGRTTIELAMLKDQKVLKNTLLFISWYKMNSGMYEVVIYLT